MLKKVLMLSAVACLVLGAATANAVPLLQIYIEGATYNAVTETWEVTNSGGTLRLWVIGNVNGEGGAGTIEDVMLTAAVATSELAGGTIGVTGTQVDGDGNYSGVDDPSAAANPTLMIDPNVTANDGDNPLLGDGSDLPSHGIYGAGTSFFQWSLGDFTLTDSPIDDYISSFPTIGADNEGQINAYDIVITGFTTVHFDAFNHVEGGNDGKYINAPFSHDGEGGGSGGQGGQGGQGGAGGEAPEPGTLALLGMGLVGLAGARRRS